MSAQLPSHPKRSGIPDSLPNPPGRARQGRRRGESPGSALSPWERGAPAIPRGRSTERPQLTPGTLRETPAAPARPRRAARGDTGETGPARPDPSGTRARRYGPAAAPPQRPSGHSVPGAMALPRVPSRLAPRPGPGPLRPRSPVDAIFSPSSSALPARPRPAPRMRRPAPPRAPPRGRGERPGERAPGARPAPLRRPPAGSTGRGEPGRPGGQRLTLRSAVLPPRRALFPPPGGGMVRPAAVRDRRARGARAARRSGERGGGVTSWSA